MSRTAAKGISTAALGDLSREAKRAPRLRAHLNVHPTLDDPVQRLFIALEPGTYIRPHRHPEPNKWELFVLIEGAVDALTFGDDGTLRERIRMGRKDGSRAVEIPPGTWHSYVCFEPGTVVLEIKEGPYVATTEEDYAPWSPQGDADSAARYLDRLRGV